MEHRSSSGAPSALPDDPRILPACAAVREFQDIRSALAGCELKAQMLCKNRASKHGNRKPVMRSQGFGRRQKKELALC